MYLDKFQHYNKTQSFIFVSLKIKNNVFVVWKVFGQKKKSYK